MRFDEQDRDWPRRPWIMAVIGAVGGLVIYLLTANGTDAAPLAVWRQAAATFTAIAVLSFLLTVELRRWTWSIAFAVGCGAVLAMIGWLAGQYNQVPEILESSWSGILAVLLAVPLFQTIRDEGGWRFPYARLHRHAWTDSVIGAASLAFTGVVFLLALLIAALFHVIGIDQIKELLKEDWFSSMLAGLAFGGAVGLLRERDALAATLQKLVMIVLSVLAPVLAVALVAFLASLPFTGLRGLWDADIPVTPMLLLSGAGAILLANAVIGDGRDDRSPNVWLRRAALLLVVCVFPLVILAAVSMGQRIGQYGWTPERIWGVVTVGIALAYGVAGWWAVFKGRRDFDDPLRPLQTDMAIGLCGLALFLALPILDFGAISARSQLARLESGQVKAEEFDWEAMAFDFGPSGRQRLADIAKTGAANVRDLAKAALASENRYDVTQKTEDVAQAARLDRYLRILSPDITLSDKLKAQLIGVDGCNDKPCALLRLDQQHLLLVRNPYGATVESSVIDPKDGLPIGTATQPENADLAKATIEVRPIQRRQLYVDSKPVGEPFE